MIHLLKEVGRGKRGDLRGSAAGCRIDSRIAGNPCTDRCLFHCGTHQNGKCERIGGIR